MKNDFQIRGSITVIFLKLKDGKILETLIDTEDLPLAQTFPNKWFACLDPKTNRYYVHGHVTRYKATQLHRWLTGEPGGLVVDHFNHDTLDNRRSANLRVVTQAVNTMNKSGARSDSLTGIRGVSWHKRVKKWVARISLNGKSSHLGYFDTKEEASTVAKQARQGLGYEQTN